MRAKLLAHAVHDHFNLVKVKSHRCARSSWRRHLNAHGYGANAALGFFDHDKILHA